MKSYFRPEIDAIEGYVPGEQPKIANLIKLNTNENPYPPSPRVGEALKEFNWNLLERYPDPACDLLRDDLGARYGFPRNMVIAGNGSDDLLTMIFRSFTDPARPVAVFEPSYSLYPVLAAMQGAPVIRIALEEKRDFALPEDVLLQAKGANLLMITRPNAPTGNAYPKAAVRELCARFDGIVVIDQAYADFAEDNCDEFARDFSNVLVMRTFSKSFSLAGLRLGCAFGNPVLIDGLMKLKDSYNVDRIAQTIARAALADQDYLQKTLAAIRSERARLTNELSALGFRCIPSQANFIFCTPPGGDGERVFKALRAEAVLVRYFAGPVTGKYLRITIGTPAENTRLLEVLKTIVSA